MKISEENEDKVYIVAALVLAAIFVISLFSTDFFITIIFLFLSATLFLFSLKSTYKLLLKTGSFFILFHFIIFPYIYVVLMEIDSKSFEFDPNVEQREILDAEKEIAKEYKVEKISNDKAIINALLNTKNSYLDSTFEAINNDNIIFIDSFMVHKTITNYKISGQPPIGIATLAICDSKGVNLTKLRGDYTDVISHDLSIKEFLLEKINIIKKVNDKLELDIEKIKNKEIWAYKRILAYSINIFDTDNMKPKTRVSNIIFFFHKLIIVFFVLSIFVAAFYQFLMDYKKNN